MKFVDNGSNNAQDFCVSSIGHISLIVKEDSIKQRRYHAVIDHLMIFCFLDVDIDELENFFLDGSQSSDFRSLGLNVSYKLVSTR